MSAEAWSNLKDKAACEGEQSQCRKLDCPLFGTLLKPNRDGKRRVRGCDDNVARGKRNKAKGGRKQAKAVTALGIPRSTLRPGHEEFLPGSVRVEVKAGSRMAGPVWTRFLLAEAQSEAARPFGDNRPFVAVFMPDDTSDGLALFRLSKVDDVVVALAEQRGLVP